ncbi:MAG: hypothetical protein ACKOAZ_09730 [Ilumatobacteraceae bacterium]
MSCASHRAARYATAAAALSLMVAGTAAPTIDAGARPDVASRGQIELVAQTFDVAANGLITIDLRLSAEALESGAQLVVTAHRPIERRAQVAEAVDGVLTRTADSVDLALADLLRLPGGAVRAVVPVERSTRTGAALQLARPGLYPLVIEVARRGDVTAELITFIHRLPDADEEDQQPINLAFVMSARRSVRIEPSALEAALIDEGTIDEMSRLVDSLEASRIPIAVSFSPAVAAALPDSGSDAAALAERLAAVLPEHRVLPSSLWPLSPTAAAAAGIAPLYGRWLRDGEDALAAAAGSPPSRNVLLADEALSAGGGALLRDLGARMVILPVDRYDELPGSLSMFTDSTQLVQLGVDDDTTVDALVVDRYLSSRLAATTTQPLLAAIEIVADIVAAREEIDLNGGAPARHGLLLAAPGVGIIPAALLEPLSTLLAATPAVTMVTVDELSTGIDRLLIDGTEVVIPLGANPPAGASSTGGAALSSRLSQAAAVSLDIATTGSMLADDDPRLGEWQRRIELLPTPAISDEGAGQMIDGIAAELADIRSSVVMPDGFSFTLTGRSTEIPVKLFSTASAPLRVVVRLSSTKLLFPDAPTEVVLAPGEYTEVLVPVEARTNGRFPVTLEVVTPVGGVPLGSPVTLSAGVNALRGLGPLVTGALLLIVLSWWLRHVRQSRRRRFALAHPSGRGGTSAEVTPTLGTEASAAAPLIIEADGGDQR